MCGIQCFKTKTIHIVKSVTVRKMKSTKRKMDITMFSNPINSNAETIKTSYKQHKLLLHYFIGTPTYNINYN